MALGALYLKNFRLYLNKTFGLVPCLLIAASFKTFFKIIKLFSLPWISRGSKGRFTRGPPHKWTGTHAWSSGFRGCQMATPTPRTPRRRVRTIGAVPIQTFPSSLRGSSSVGTNWPAPVVILVLGRKWSPARPGTPGTHGTPTSTHGSIPIGGVYDFVTVLADLIHGLFRAFNGFTGQSMEFGEYPVLGFTCKVPDAADTAVIFTDGFIEENPGPISGSKFGFS